MCGIIGLLIKNPTARSELGRWVTPMVACMSERGPDSAGLAVFGAGDVAADTLKYSLYQPGAPDWRAFADAFNARFAGGGELTVNDRHAVLRTSCRPGELNAWLAEAFPLALVLSTGRKIDMYKDVGTPAQVAARYKFEEFHGSHAVGHTRMATESAVSPAHAHPFTAGEDFCLVHNGSLSNPYSLRRRLERRGVRFQTDNDTEAACRFLEWRMRDGDTLETALERGFEELDGFYTLLMATADRLVLVRDAFACKPAVVAETDDYVAVASEFRSLAHLPGISGAKLFEPEPRRIHSWTV